MGYTAVKEYGLVRESRGRCARDSSFAYSLWTSREQGRRKSLCGGRTATNKFRKSNLGRYILGSAFLFWPIDGGGNSEVTS